MAITTLRALVRLPSIRSRLSASTTTTTTTTARSYSSSLRPPSLLTHHTRPQLLLGSRHLIGTHPKRSFSLAAPVEAAISQTEHLLSYMHAATGTPWYITIPLFALVFGIVRLPTTIYLAKRAAKARKLLPLSRANAVASNKAIMHRLPHAGFIGHSKAVKSFGEEQKQRLKRFNKEWALQPWKVFLAQAFPLPIWLLGIDAIRRHCGGPAGFLSLLSTSARKSAEANSAGAGTAVDTAVANSQIQDAVVSQGFDPSLMTEGCLWFTDLTVCDPYGVLPFALSALMLFNMKPWRSDRMHVLLGTKAKDASVELPKRWVVVATRSQLLLCLAIGPVTMSLPAAMHLYWLSTLASSSLLQSVISRAVTKASPTIATPEWAKGRDEIIIRPTREAYPLQKL
ncbi:hypothetical protein QBC43DRAFT_79409 [Cladorrhinum sp. PSN259]|nr:hypothetical protein QBC43DRAFT_79409 [Cladorrhinum sp. PSN259]